ncbi:Asp-tRNA(Asn)/Glu-tRNA(Gln) amidotransferase subunit GatA [Candidatus Micrarchaeota archaeon]|nr:Asp-tRNA(Asn)/Glu-tRNA(Gln) amidotransferase subunit GatA [Candidatus Micrarchaeota archaeon]
MVVTKELVEGMRKGECSASGHLEEKTKVIEQKEGQLNAFLHLDFEGARKKAGEIDEKIRKKKKLGKLAGLVIAIKDNICVEGMPCTAASKMLENYVAPYNATVVEKILQEDGIIIGKTNLDEFACGSDCTKSAFKISRNPVDTERVTGGSSGGSAVAVASGMADLALGSDTGGSIRCPASFCGVVGFKPTYGLVSRYGLLDLAMSFDQIGPFSKDTYGAALLMEVISGEDPRDSVTKGTKDRDYTRLLDKTKKKLKIGIAKEFFEGCDKEVEKVVKEIIEKLGERHEILEVPLPISRYSVPIYFLNVFAEFSSAMQKYDGLKYGAFWEELNLVDAVSEVRDRTLGKEVKRRILLGTYITMKEFKDAWYTKTLKARDLMRKEFDNAFKKVDLLASPTNPSLPWKIGEKNEDPVQMYLADTLTTTANICGIPAGVVKAAFCGKLPVGVQFMGRIGEDEKVLAAMKSVEELAGRDMDDEHNNRS